jgi:hypothetical protein
MRSTTTIIATVTTRSTAQTLITPITRSATAPAEIGNGPRMISIATATVSTAAAVAALAAVVIVGTPVTAGATIGGVSAANGTTATRWKSVPTSGLLCRH